MKSEDLEIGGLDLGVVVCLVVLTVGGCFYNFYALGFGYNYRTALG